MDLTGKLEDELKRIKAKEKDMMREIQDNLNSEVAGLYRAIREAENELKKQRSRERIDRAKKQLESIGKEADRQSRELGERLSALNEQEPADSNYVWAIAYG